ncbi:MAG: fasciclin domain-containing protein [Planctomycetaceae bacterium]|nr:fasciclin domain-containing protein [Planctomycetales bacterium]MCB9939136.1 fasciclin domain-containing protein [Planctomycetaceae bacterium]
MLIGKAPASTRPDVRIEYGSGRLTSAGPFTVFAPTDEAFAKLPAGTVESLLKPENKEKLAAILKYQVVPGRVYSEDALAAKKATTLKGSEIHVSVSGGQAKINDAKLLTTDLDASNGVIHVIDSVILPAAKATKLGSIPSNETHFVTTTCSATCNQRVARRLR